MTDKKRKKTKVAAPRPKVTAVTIVICTIVTVIILISGVFIGTVMDYASSSDGELHTEYISNAIDLVTAHPSWMVTSMKKEGSKARSIPFILLLIWGIFLLYKYSEETRRTHRKGVEHGSAKWGNDKEKHSLEEKNETEIVTLKDAEGNLIYDDDGELVAAVIDKSIILSEDVKISLNTWFHRLNLNVLIIGGSGSGKTRFFALPNIMQLSTSFVITDPKGEILMSTGKMLEQAGYKVRVLNLIDMEHSNNYNPFHYVYNNNGDLSEDNIKKMVDVLFKNTKGDGEKEDFWSQKGQSLLEAIVFLLFEESEYNAETEVITDEKTGVKRTRIKSETRDLSHLNFFSVAEKMRRLQYPSNGQKIPDGFFLQRNPGESEDQFRERQNHAFLCPLDKDFIELEKRKGETLAGRLYKEVRNAPEETGQSFLSSANVKTFFFNLTNLSNLTCCDNIHLETLGDEKTALFILIPATSRTYNFVAAMLYTQMFDVLSNRANFKYGGVLPVHVRCIMDEFYNIGEIPDFEVVIGFVRSMGISLNVILQNLSQIKSRYEKTWENITGNCDSLLFLGGNEDSTLKYISETLGKETIDVRGYNKTKGKSPSTSENNSIMGRELMQPNEVKTMPITDCIVMLKSHNPFYCSKYSLEDHPNYKLLGINDDNNKYLISSIHAVTINEFEKQFIKTEIVEEVDTSINSFDKKIINESKEQIKHKMSVLFNAESTLKNEENIVLSDQDSIVHEYDEEFISDIIEDALSQNVDEEYTNGPKFGEVSEPDTLDFGQPVKQINKEEEANDETVIAVFLEPIEEITEIHYAEISQKEEVQLTENVDATMKIHETFVSNNSFEFTDINDMLGFS